MRFAEPFSHIKTQDIGPLPDYDTIALRKEWSDPDCHVLQTLVKVMGMVNINYERGTTVASVILKYQLSKLI